MYFARVFVFVTILPVPETGPECSMISYVRKGTYERYSSLPALSKLETH